MPLAFLLRGARHASHDIFFCAPLQSAGDYIRLRPVNYCICFATSLKMYLYYLITYGIIYHVFL